MLIISFTLAMLIIGILIGGAAVYILLPKPQQKNLDWNLLLGQEVDYESCDIRGFSRYGRRIRNWGHNKGCVKEVKGKMVNIDNHWYKMSDIRLIGG